MRAEDLRSELYEAASQRHSPAPIRADQVVTYHDRGTGGLRGVLDAHGQRIDRVRSAALADGGVHVMILATASGGRGLVANHDGLQHFYAFVPGGSVELVSDDGETEISGE